MLAKEKVKKQLKRQFKKPIPSTQYIAFQKEHRDYPSYHQLKGLYGSWDVLSWEVWGLERRFEPGLLKKRSKKS